MKNNVKNNILRMALAICIAASGIGYAAADTGAAAMSFLKADSGARAAAMGGAYSATEGGASSIFYNPAGAASLKRTEVFMSHSIWLDELSLEHIAAAFVISPAFTFTAGAAAQIASINSYDSLSNPTGSFDATDMAATSGIAYTVSDSLFVGMQAKYFSQQGKSVSANALGGDAGLLYKRGRFNYGVSAMNLGNKIKLGNNEFPLPKTIRAGINMEAAEGLRVGADYIDYVDSGAHLALGCEYRLPVLTEGSRAMMVRGGYYSGRDKNTGTGISGGIGFSNDFISLDYSFTPFGDLGNGHRFSMTIRFGQVRESAAK